mmetsp:Transcript_27424/g.55185  ORF Transcript_27424/g.55185 Transcript_27424/m.55185 type:complete len:155 (+) Transcript_27424:33-497(+)
MAASPQTSKDVLYLVAISLFFLISPSHSFSVTQLPLRASSSSFGKDTARTHICKSRPVRHGAAGIVNCASAEAASVAEKMALGTQYPEMVVFDLDACLWDQEMYALDSLPTKKVYGDLGGRGEGVTGVMSGSDKISLFVIPKFRDFLAMPQRMH